MAAGKKAPYLLKPHSGRKMIDTSKAPDWWLSRTDEAEKYLRALKGVETWEMGCSAGGRPILCAAWGAREELPGRTSVSLASALDGGSASAFYGRGRRNRQSFLFLGNAHGMEYEGTVAALNFLNVVVTGKDLRGRRWPRLREAGRQLRILIIPHFNMDGRARTNVHKHMLNVEYEQIRRLGMGDRKNGEKMVWPKVKLITPLPAEEMDPLGAYFNDKGVNLVYDNGFYPQMQPETKALLALLREERPDCALLSHTNNGSLVMEPDSFIPERFRLRQAQISALAGVACRYAGRQKSRITVKPVRYGGEVFYQSDMIYHTCGALPVMVEFPYGHQNQPDNFDELLDISMTVLEEIVCFGVAYGFRPPEPTE